MTHREVRVDDALRKERSEGVIRSPVGKLRAPVEEVRRGFDRHTKPLGNQQERKVGDEEGYVREDKRHQSQVLRFGADWVHYVKNLVGLVRYTYWGIEDRVCVLQGLKS